MTKKFVYAITIGELIDKDDPRYNAYTYKDFYPNEFSFFDMSRMFTFSKGHAAKEIIKFVERFILEPNDAYIIVLGGYLDLSDKDIVDILQDNTCSCGVLNPTKDTCEYFAYITDHELITKIESKDIRRIIEDLLGGNDDDSRD